MQNDHESPNDGEYIIKIYHAPAEIGFPIRGRDQFLKEIAFLDELAGWPSAGLGRFIPDSVDGYYVLDDKQYELYLSFRKTLSVGADTDQE